MQRAIPRVGQVDDVIAGGRRSKRQLAAIIEEWHVAAVDVRAPGWIVVGADDHQGAVADTRQGDVAAQEIKIAQLARSLFHDDGARVGSEKLELRPLFVTFTVMLVLDTVPVTL